jgi:hypothetical protein
MRAIIVWCYTCGEQCVVRGKYPEGILYERLQRSGCCNAYTDAVDVKDLNA